MSPQRSPAGAARMPSWFLRALLLGAGQPVQVTLEGEQLAAADRRLLPAPACPPMARESWPISAARS